MKAVLLRHPGGLDQLELADVEEPRAPGPGEIRSRFASARARSTTMITWSWRARRPLLISSFRSRMGPVTSSLSAARMGPLTSSLSAAASRNTRRVTG